MARPRAAAKEEKEGQPKRLMATQVGGSGGQRGDIGVNLAVPGEYPEDYEEEGTPWKTGYDMAARKGNTVKACIVFANNYQGEELADSELEAEIERLQKLRDARS